MQRRRRERSATNREKRSTTDQWRETIREEEPEDVVGYGNARSRREPYGAKRKKKEKKGNAGTGKTHEEKRGRLRAADRQRRLGWEWNIKEWNQAGCVLGVGTFSFRSLA